MVRTTSLYRMRVERIAGGPGEPLAARQAAIRNPRRTRTRGRIGVSVPWHVHKISTGPHGQRSSPSNAGGPSGISHLFF